MYVYNLVFCNHRYDVICRKVLNFIVKTALDSLETDGPYGGGSCASTNHDYHLGLEDSIYWQNYYQGKFYSELKKLNIFINQPDRYFYQGGNKAVLGYDETQFNLPRWQDLTVSRAGMFDDTYHNIPTQGWMFLPLTQYHGGEHVHVHVYAQWLYPSFTVLTLHVFMHVYVSKKSGRVCMRLSLPPTHLCLCTIHVHTCTFDSGRACIHVHVGKELKIA